MKKEVEDLFEKGMSKEEIYTFIVNKYGDEVGGCGVLRVLRADRGRCA